MLETFRDPKDVIEYMLQATESAKVAMKIGVSLLLPQNEGFRAE